MFSLIFIIVYFSHLNGTEEVQADTSEKAKKFFKKGSSIFKKALIKGAEECGTLLAKNANKRLQKHGVEIVKHPKPDESTIPEVPSTEK